MFYVYKTKFWKSERKMKKKLRKMKEKIQLQMFMSCNAMRFDKIQSNTNETLNESNSHKETHFYQILMYC